MVVYVTYRGPVEEELEAETGEIMDVHIVDEKMEGPLGVFEYELQPIKGGSRSERWNSSRSLSGPAESSDTE
jgi:hypothetical protein